MADNVKKIVFVSFSSENHTGSPKALLDLVANLDREKYSPCLLVPEEGPLARDFRQVGGEVFVLQSLSLGESSIVAYLKSIKRFYAFYKQHQVALLHINGIGWRESVVAAAWLARIPVLLNLHNPYPSNEVRGNFNFLLSKKVVIVSESMRANFSNYPGILRKIQCIHNGVDLKKFSVDLGSFRNSLPIVNDGPVIGYVGQLCERKGVDLLVKAAPALIKLFPDALFLMAGADGVGEEGYTERMKALADDLGIVDRFVFLGKRDDVPEVMNACDLVVVPSRAEPFGKVIIEAMACGKCVIASAVGGIPEIVRNERNGLLITAEDVEALQGAMVRALSDDELRASLADEGRRTAHEAFSIESLVDKTQRLYAQLLNNDGVVMDDGGQAESGEYSLRSEGISYRNLDIYYRYRSVKEILPAGSGRCLDLGARDSNFKQFIIDQGYTYLGIDIDQHPSLDVVGDGCLLPFADNSFDLVVLAQVLEHVFDPKAAVNEVYRVLKPGGVLVGGVSFLEPYHHSYMNLSHRAVEDMLQSAGFKNICLETGVTGIVLILARILGLFGSNNLKLFSAVSRVMFPVKYLLRFGYASLRLIKRFKGNDLRTYDRNVRDHYEALALSIAGHLLFRGEKND